MTRLATMLAIVLSSGTLGTSAFVDAPKTVIWNASSSAPIGLYSLQADGSVDVTDLSRLCRRRRSRNSWRPAVICRSACQC
jgi:type IV secretory pathway protease TraF